MKYTPKPLLATQANKPLIPSLGIGWSWAKKKKSHLDAEGWEIGFAKNGGCMCKIGIKDPLGTIPF